MTRVSLRRRITLSEAFFACASSVGTKYACASHGSIHWRNEDAAERRPCRFGIGDPGRSRLLIALSISIALVLACILCHYEALRAVNDFVPRVMLVPKRARILVAIGGAVVSHVFQVVLFAFAYYLLRDHYGLGTFAGHFRDAFSSFLYFSTETYTTTGFGDIRPIGYVRLLIGVEALTGLVMVGWTVSFSYLQMQRFW